MTRPHYIPSDLEATAVDYVWDEDFSDDLLMPRDVGHEFFTVNPCASALVTAACGEWVVYRLAKLTTAADVEHLLGTIDAVFAAAAGSPVEAAPSNREWLDDVHEDVNAALANLDIVLQRAVELCAEGDTLIGLTAYGAAQVARRVCAETQFGPWLDRTLATLTARYPAQRNAHGVILADRPQPPPDRSALT